MNSKLTLVPEQPTLKLIFSKNSTLNANILVNDTIRYIVSTTDRSLDITKIFDAATKKELVVIKRRTILPDKIIFADRGGGVAKKLSEVMQETVMDDGQ